jgi:hypothetical protein|tara:strand:- start:43 stop:555 length:513 start_codon:yes stop_codon:yes gene_type:complete
MNIFAIEKNGSGDVDWEKSAQSQDNYRVVKMILESCQILSTVLNEQGVQAPYKSFNPKHPSCLWAAESSANFENLALHCFALIGEYAERFEKDHKCTAVLGKIIELYDPTLFPTNEATPLKMAMPEEFKSSDIVESYRKYYASKERMRYPADKVPTWFERYRGDQPYTVI